jgi:hypothetical protein
MELLEVDAVMVKRTSQQTATAAINRLFPPTVGGGVRATLQKANYRAETLLDAIVNGAPVVANAVNGFAENELIHRSVAAVLCRRSENTVGNEAKKIGTYEELKKKGWAEKRKGKKKGGGNNTELFYSLGFARTLAERLAGAKDRGDDKRAETAKTRAQEKAIRATRTPMLWLTDDEGRLYCEIKYKALDGSERIGKLIRSGARIEILTLQVAMTERVWRDPTAREPWHREYLQILDAERALSEQQQRESMGARLDDDLPIAQTARPRTRL